MEETTTKYPSFEWKPGWMEKIMEICKAYRRTIEAYSVVVEYGLNDNIISTRCLLSDFVDYFNEVIKPDLDDQHIRYKRDILPFEIKNSNHERSDNDSDIQG